MPASDLGDMMRLFLRHSAFSQVALGEQPHSWVRELGLGFWVSMSCCTILCMVSSVCFRYTLLASSCLLDTTEKKQMMSELCHGNMWV